MGLKINESEIKAMKVSPKTDLVLTINSTEVEQVKSFTCLGSIMNAYYCMLMNYETMWANN